MANVPSATRGSVPESGRGGIANSVRIAWLRGQQITRTFSSPSRIECQPRQRSSSDKGGPTSRWRDDCRAGGRAPAPSTRKARAFQIAAAKVEKQVERIDCGLKICDAPLLRGVLPGHAHIFQLGGDLGERLALAATPQIRCPPAKIAGIVRAVARPHGGGLCPGLLEALSRVLA